MKRLALAGLAALIVILALLAYREVRRGREVVEARITVNTSKLLGRFKDLRGVNCGPLSPRGWDTTRSLNLTDYYVELGIRVIRFHDLHMADDLDIIFPNPDADPCNPASYSFSALDENVEAAQRVAKVIILRIGFDWHDPPKNRPHVNLNKLASVVKHIVLHYAKGWANGYRYHNILWEIWNEPDIDRFWALSAQEYFRLYETLAKAVKRADPEAMVGGPTIAYNLTFLEEFLNYTRSRGVPLDFVSWHAYSTNPRDIVERARRVREIMVKYGYEELPSVLDEWNYWWNKEPWDFFRGPTVAAFQTSTLIWLQDAPVDIAVLYRGDAWNWGGMFYADGRPGKPFYAWLAFKRLIEGTVRVEAGVEGYELAVAAGLAPNGSLYVLISNHGDLSVRYRLELDEEFRVIKALVVDANQDLSSVDACDGLTCVIGPHAVQLLELERPSGQ
ncbi:MAG: hypothetical protein DRJ57_00690 [Thermoprotei archaeon]|nr:MAG: hypothetical protein DRJ57_00690 [Thermoprotei archaeon]